MKKENDFTPLKYTEFISIFGDLVADSRIFEYANIKGGAYGDKWKHLLYDGWEGDPTEVYVNAYEGLKKDVDAFNKIYVRKYM